MQVICSTSFEAIALHPARGPRGPRSILQAGGSAVSAGRPLLCRRRSIGQEVYHGRNTETLCRESTRKTANRQAEIEKRATHRGNGSTRWRDKTFESAKTSPRPATATLDWLRLPLIAMTAVRNFPIRRYFWHYHRSNSVSAGAPFHNHSLREPFSVSRPFRVLKFSSSAGDRLALLAQVTAPRAGGR